ncbi:hypothetical protein [Caballeronia sp. AZ10_KS36]|uniref:hypothetical protein n=1 Tax=Caballeronia sp. AZ10_KS36 TaxID=2921757 RepID=UPI002028CBA8|nr:hypothetical protein [Caballeronia sp. AZ10_KS36]
MSLDYAEFMQLLSVAGLSSASSTTKRDGIPTSTVSTTLNADQKIKQIVIPALGPVGRFDLEVLWGFSSDSNTKTIKITDDATGIVLLQSTGFAASQSLRSLTSVSNQNNQKAQVAASSSTVSAFGTGTALLNLALDFTVARTINIIGNITNAASTVTCADYKLSILNP